MTDDDPSVRELISAYVQVQTPSAAAVDHAWRTLDARVRAGDGPTLAGAPKLAFGLRFAIVVGIAAVAAGSAVVVELLGASSGPPPGPMPTIFLRSIDLRPTSIVAEPPREPEVLPGAAIPTVTTATQPKTVASTPAPRRARTPAPEAPSLAAELELLRATRTALRGGEAQRALDLAGRHRRRYPRSAFAEERSATEVMALCVLGRVDAAKSKAAGFRRLYPGSSFEAGLVASCDEAATASKIDR